MLGVALRTCIACSASSRTDLIVAQGKPLSCLKEGMKSVWGRGAASTSTFTSRRRAGGGAVFTIASLVLGSLVAEKRFRGIRNVKCDRISKEQSVSLMV